jgi:hypothetical protein
MPRYQEQAEYILEQLEITRENVQNLSDALKQVSGLAWTRSLCRQLSLEQLNRCP